MSLPVQYHCFYTKCRFCGEIFPLQLQNVRNSTEFQVCRVQNHHPESPYGCFELFKRRPNPNDEGKFWCSSCGAYEGDTTFISSSQKTKKEHLARCSECIGSNRHNLFAPFEQALFDNGIGEQLMKAVERFNVEETRRLLEKGADPNHVRQCDGYLGDDERRVIGGYSHPLWNADGTPYQKDYSFQPFRPLKLALFLATGSHYDTNAETKLAEIAKLLLDFGAPIEPVEELYPHLGYSIENEDDCSNEVFAVLQNARRCIRQVLNQCRHDETFRFEKYFASNGSRDDPFQLTRNAVMASRELHPFYAFERAHNRLLSQKQAIFVRKHRRPDGTVLCVLPHSIETRIRALALILFKPHLQANQIPDPLV